MLCLLIEHTESLYNLFMELLGQDTSRLLKKT